MNALDIEIFPNFSLIVIGDKLWSTSTKFDLRQKEEIIAAMKAGTTYGFNSNNYDIPLIKAALKGSPSDELFRMSKDIISNRLPPWAFYTDYGIKPPSKIDHFDLSQPAPAVMISLKMYGARMHMRKLQDLPYAFDSHLTEDQKLNVIKYCFNDIATTEALYEQIKDRIDLRIKLGEKYGMDLRSKSDAQIAEAIIKSEVGSVESTSPPESIIYKKPDFITGDTTFIENHKFLMHKGKIQLPKDMPLVKIGDMTYKFGIGGIHSTEKSQTVIPNDDEILVDRDVVSYYPSIILELGLYPEGVGEKFLPVYRNIFNTRLEAKEKAKKGDVEAATVRDGYKIALNGSYGKFGSPYSVLYAPELLLQTTLTGQLALLMLIQALHDKGIKTVSANTDGFVSIMPRSKHDEYDSICLDWELATGFVLEETEYRSLHSRDVNTYIAITADGKVKGKGDYAPSTLMKSPRCVILGEAVKAHLLNGASIDATIRNCTDITKFIAVRNVKGGAEGGLGKVVRWYYSTQGAPILYASNGNKVATTDGAMPIMDLPDTLPDDIDYQKYIDDANKMMGLLC